MLRRKLAASAMSAVLAASLCPGLAMAAPLAGGSIDGGGSTATALDTQGKKSVWVVSSIRYSNPSSSSSSSTSKTYTYNGKGLLTKAYRSYSYRGNNYSSSSSTTNTLKYKGNNLSKITTSYWYSGQTSSSKPSVYTFKSKKGHVAQATTKNNSGNNDYKYVYTYKRNAAGGVKSYTTTYYSNYNNDGTYSKKLKKRSWANYNYSKFTKNRPGKMITKSKSSNGSSTTSAPTTYKYDKKGNLKRQRYGDSSATVYKYTYNGNRVATRKYDTSSSGTVFYYTWKKVSVPSSLVNKVKAQQWSIINNNLNFAFGPVSMGV